MLQVILDYLRENEWLEETIHLNTDHYDPTWNPSMYSTATIVAEQFDMDADEPDFEGLWIAACEIIRRQD